MIGLPVPPHAVAWGGTLSGLTLACLAATRRALPCAQARSHAFLLD